MGNKPVILITGASSGIGEATARRFGREGYHIVIAARRIDRLEALGHEISKMGGEALPVAADLSKLEDIHAIVQASIERFGRIDILFNNAGFGRLGWLENLDPIKDIEAQIQVNLLGVIQMTQAVLPYMIHQKNGHIINMGSMAGWVATPTYTIYAAGKFAVRGFSDALRREVGVYGIHVSVVYPGGVATEFGQHTGAKRKTGMTTPDSLRLTPEKVAECIYSLSKHPKRSAVLPWIMRFAIVLNTLFPGVMDWLSEERFVKIERGLK